MKEVNKIMATLMRIKKEEMQQIQQLDTIMEEKIKSIDPEAIIDIVGTDGGVEYWFIEIFITSRKLDKIIPMIKETFPNTRTHTPPSDIYDASIEVISKMPNMEEKTMTKRNLQKELTTLFKKTKEADRNLINFQKEVESILGEQVNLDDEFNAVEFWYPGHLSGSDKMAIFIRCKPTFENMGTIKGLFPNADIEAKEGAVKVFWRD